MIILVSDTSVLIDLEKGGLLEAIFALGLSLVVPDYLYDKELKDANGPYLRTLGLGVLELSPQELEAVQELKMLSKGLSTPDCFALICALRKNHKLITGDRLLKQEAVAKQVEVYGLFWLLDILENAGASYDLLYEALEKISNDVKCSLPKIEIKARLDKWSKPI